MRRRLVLVTGGLLLLAELEVLAACDDELLLGLALLALQPEGHLLGGLGLKGVECRVTKEYSAFEKM